MNSGSMASYRAAAELPDRDEGGQVYTEDAADPGPLPEEVTKNDAAGELQREAHRLRKQAELERPIINAISAALAETKKEKRSRRLVVPLPSHLADHLRQISGFTGETMQALLARVAGREELQACVKNAGLAALAEADQRALAARKALEEL